MGNQGGNPWPLALLLTVLVCGASAHPRLNNPLLVTRAAAYEACNGGSDEADDGANNNCHTAFTANLPRTPAMDTRANDLRSSALMPEHVTSSNHSLTFCYLSSLGDSLFSAQGTRHRPALTAPVARRRYSSNMVRYGNEHTFTTQACMYFGSTADASFTDTQGWTVSAIAAKPFVTVSGKFRVGVNTRPVQEDQVVFWKLVHSSTGDPDAAFTVREESFRAYRESADSTAGVVNGGAVEIEPVALHGFEKGYLGLWVRVEYSSLNLTELDTHVHNGHLQAAHEGRPLHWDVTGDVAYVDSGDGEWMAAGSPLGTKVLVLSGDGAAISQQLIGGSDGDEVTVRLACASRASHTEATVQVLVGGEVVIRQLCPADGYGYFEGTFVVDAPNRTLTIVNSQGGSAKKCNELEGWTRNDENLPCAAASALGNCNDLSTVTHTDAAAKCGSVGARLCTVKELMEGSAAGTGCGEGEPTWAEDGCPNYAARAYTVSREQGVYKAACLSRQDRAMVRCCADDAATVDTAVLLADLTLSTATSREEHEGMVAVCDDGVVVQYSEPANPDAYAQATEEHRQAAEAEAQATGAAAAADAQAVLAPSMAPVLVYDFSKEKFANAAAEGKELDIVDLGVPCQQNNSFVTDTVFGREQSVFRFAHGTGLQIPQASTVVNTASQSHYTVSVVVKLDSTQCYVRLLNVAPQHDNGLYVCDGLQLVPERAAGHQLRAMEWHHIAVATDSERHTKLFHNGRLLYSWVPSRHAWKGLQIGNDEIVLFNDCGAECGCNSEEGSGGWIASVKVWNRMVTEDEMEEQYNKLLEQSGVLGHFDFTTESTDNAFPLDQLDALVDHGAKCERPFHFTQDETLHGTFGHWVAALPSGSGLQLPSLASRLSSSNAYSLVTKFKLVDEPPCGAWLVRVSAEVGVRVCGGFLKVGEQKHPVSARLRVGAWHTLAVVASGDKGARVYVDGALHTAVSPSQLDFSVEDDVLFFNGDALDDCGASRATVESVACRVSHLSLWNRALSYSELIDALDSLGSELKFTRDASAVGGTVLGTTSNTAGPNAACALPFSHNGRVYDDCAVASAVCKTTMPSADSGFRAGYCVQGGGYMQHTSKTISGHDVGECRGGVLGCQRICNSLTQCIGFTIPKCGTWSAQHAPAASAAGLAPMGSTHVTRSGMGVVARATQDGVASGVLQGGIGVVSGQTYELVVHSDGDMLQGDARVYVLDARGAVALEGSTALSREGTVVRVRFTAREAVVGVGVECASMHKGDAFAVTRMDMASAECVGQNADMAIGMLKGEWGDLADDSSVDLFQRVHTAPLVDVNATSTTPMSLIARPPLLSPSSDPAAPSLALPSCASPACLATTDAMGGGGVLVHPPEGVVAGARLAKSEKKCSQLSGWTTVSSWTHSTPAPCGASTKVGCYSSKTHSAAAKVCESKGGRLCTLAEVQNNAVSGTGCGYDTAQIWTATGCECEAKRCSSCSCADCFYATAGNPSSGSGIATQCLPASTNKAVRCCADHDTSAPAENGGCSYRTNTDLPGYDLRSFRDATIASCCSACFSEPLCLAWSFHSPSSMCYLKRSGVLASANDAFVSGFVRRVAPSGHQKLEGYDHPGNDIRDYQATELRCSQDCDAQEGCVGFLFRPSDNHCWLKRAMPRSTTRRVDGLVSEIRSGARFVRLVQVGGVGTGTWEIQHLELFSDFALQSPVPQPAAVTSSAHDSAHPPAHATSRDFHEYWKASSASGAWISLDFGTSNPFPLVQSVWIKSRGVGTRPSTVQVQESWDGQVWNVVRTVDGVTDDFHFDLYGVGGGRGGAPVSSLLLPQGTGIALNNLQSILPTSHASSFTVVVRYTVGRVNEEKARYSRILNTGQGDRGLYGYGTGFVLYSATDVQGFAEGSTWRGLAMSINSMAQSVRVVVDGTVVLENAGITWSEEFNARDVLRLFNDVALDSDGNAQCSTSLEDSPVFVSRVFLYDRDMSATEATTVLESLAPQCIHPTCNGHGTCVEGVCICDRTSQGGWKGEACEERACPGVPECNENGECRDDGTCKCAVTHKGAACESLKCPGGAVECSAPTRGTCKDPYGVCECKSGWRGTDCALKTCAGDSVNSDGEYVECNGRGSCVTNAAEDDAGHCRCSTDYDGEGCTKTFVASLGNGLGTRGAVDTAHQLWTVDRTLVFPAAGKVTAWKIFARQAGTVYLQVVRDVGSNNYMLIGESRLDASASGERSVTLSAAQQITVAAGDMIGWRNEGYGVLSFDGGGNSLMYGSGPGQDRLTNKNLPSPLNRVYSVTATWRRNVAV